MLDFVKKVEKSGLLSPGETVDAAAALLPQGSIARMAGGALGGLVGVTIDSGALKKKLVLCFVDDTEVNLEAGKVIKLEPLADAITARAGR